MMKQNTHKHKHTHVMYIMQSALIGPLCPSCSQGGRLLCYAHTIGETPQCCKPSLRRGEPCEPKKNMKTYTTMTPRPTQLGSVISSMNKQNKTTIYFADLVCDWDEPLACPTTPDSSL